MNIGFIGLGNMGMGMAKNILKAGHRLTVCDLRKEIAEPLLQAGASWEDTPKSIALDKDIIFTSLPGPKEVEETALGANGIIEGVHSGEVYVDLTSNSPVLIRRIYDVFKKKGASVLDVPVSGGPAGASAGTLALMVGGDEEIFQRIRPVLEVIGDKIRYTGGIGNGSICKLMHNCIGSSFQSVIAECFTVAVKAGVDPEVLLKVVMDGAVGQGILFHRIIPGTYFKGKFDPANFALKLAYKDLGMAVGLGRDYNVPMAISNLTLQELMTAMNRGWGNRDSSVSMVLQEERAGVEVRSKGEANG
jgi:3-hydroxyisobutyrate dehydrogenase-like beta-hydroxyacid dehydrogenase